MIRMKGDIIKQLNNIYIQFSFKEKYKEELKERILNFFDSISTGTLTERLKSSKEFCIIENNEIKLFNQEFINKYNQELFNSFNPLWYKDKKEKEQEDGSDLLFQYLFYKLIEEIKEEEINLITKDFIYNQNEKKVIWETNFIFGKSLEHEKEIIIKNINQILYLKKLHSKEELLEKIKKRIYFNEEKVKKDLSMFLEYIENCLNSFYDFLIPVKKTFKIDKLSFFYEIEKQYKEHYILYNKDTLYFIEKTKDKNYFSIKSNNFDTFIFDNPFSKELQTVLYKQKKRIACLLLIKDIINSLFKIKLEKENLKQIDSIILNEGKKYPILIKRELI